MSKSPVTAKKGPPYRRRVTEARFRSRSPVDGTGLVGRAALHWTPSWLIATACRASYLKRLRFFEWPRVM